MKNDDIDEVGLGTPGKGGLRAGLRRRKSVKNKSVSWDERDHLEGKGEEIQGNEIGGEEDMG